MLNTELRHHQGRVGGTPKNRESSLLGPGPSLRPEARWSVQQGRVESLSAAASFMGGVRLHWTVGLESARKTAKCRPGKWWQGRSVVTINDPAGASTEAEAEL